MQQFFLQTLRKRLSIKILVALTTGVALVMVLIIGLGITSQRRQMLERMGTFGRELTSLVLAGIRYPMAVGDSDSIARQLREVRGTLEGTEIAICDARQKVIFATEPAWIDGQMSAILTGSPSLKVLDRLLSSSSFRPDTNSFEEQTAGHNYLVTIHSLPNAPECYRCHPPDLPVLGGLVVRQSTDETYAAIAALGNRTIFISAAGFGLLILIVHLLLTRLVTRPVEDLAMKARLVAAGDLSASVPVESEDAVGVLAASFNHMVSRVKARIEYARSLRDAIADPLFVVDTAMRITYMNEACASLTGWSREEAEGQRTCREIFQADICDTCCPVHSCFNTGEPVREVRLTMKTRDGRTVPLMASASPLRDEDGRIIGAVEVCKDISALLEAEQLRLERITTFSRELEEEVSRRTMMLREKTHLLERANRELRELDRLKSAFLANMSHELRTPMNSIIGYTDLLLDRVDGDINEEQEKSLQKVANNARHLLQLINDILDMAKIESGKVALDPREFDIRVLVEGMLSTFTPLAAKKGLTLSTSFPAELPAVFADEDKVRQVFLNLLSNAVKFTEKGGIRVGANPSFRGVRPGAAPLFLEIWVEDTGIGIREEDQPKLFDKFSQVDVSTMRQHEGTGLGLSIARGLIVLHKGVIWAESRYGEGTRITFTLPTRKEILERPAEPILEPAMAESLAAHFGKPSSTFLKAPTEAGRPIHCWEYNHCGQTSCPAFESGEPRCWLIYGTHCKGAMVASYPEKAEFCKGCEVVERVILEDFAGKEAVGSALPRPRKRPEDKGGRRVLVIDDNPEVIDLVAKTLAPDFQVLGLTNPAQAVTMAREVLPYAITLDILMPGRDGWQVLRELKNDEQTRDIPVIILSIIDDRRQGFSLGAAEYLVKPLDREELHRTLGSLQRYSPIRRVLVVDSEQEEAEMLRRFLEESGCAVTITAALGEEEAAAARALPPDMVILNILAMDEKNLATLNSLLAGDGNRNIPLVVLAREQIPQGQVETLNGRIKAVLDKSALSGEELLEQLRTTLARARPTAGDDKKREGGPVRETHPDS